MQDASKRRAVGQRRCDERLGEFRGGGDPEQVHADRVEAAPGEPADGGIAHARLPRSPRTGDDHVPSAGERCSELANVDLPADHLTGRDRLIGGKQLAAPLTRHYRRIIRQFWRIQLQLQLLLLCG
jgi:hypothetical protein